MTSLCNENMDCIIERAKESTTSGTPLAEWYSGFASKEAGENPKRIFEERVIEPLTHLNHKGNQNRQMQIRPLKTGTHPDGQW